MCRDQRLMNPTVSWREPLNVVRTPWRETDLGKLLRDKEEKF